MRTSPTYMPAAFLMGLLMLIPTVTASGATIITTLPLWNGMDEVFNWGGGDLSTSTYGQTFTAPADTFFESATFYILNDSGSGIDYQAFVYEWDGAAITGSALFTGTFATVPSSPSFQAIFVDLEWTELVTGQQYVVFLTTATTGSAIGEALWGQPGNTDPYGGGAFVFNNASTFADLNDPWTQNWLGTGGDLAFRFVFSPVPEPSTSSFLLGGAAAIFTVLSRRRPAKPAFARRLVAALQDRTSAFPQPPKVTD